MNTLKRLKIVIALVVLLAPIVGRALFYYRGLPDRPEVRLPDYAQNAIPQPPVSTAASESIKRTEGKVVVIDSYHSNGFDPSELEAYLTALTDRGARVEYDSGSLTFRLKYASAYVVFSPNYAYSDNELKAVQEFVARGGRLLVFTDPTRGLPSYDWLTGDSIVLPDVNAANILLAPYDLTFANDYLYNLLENEGNFRNVLFEAFGKNGLTTGLGRVVFYGAHSVSTKTGTALIIGDGNTFSSITDQAGAKQALPAAALSANGSVLAMGDFSFMIPPYNQIADNALLVNRLADFTLGGRITHTLADFPFVFSQPVHAWPTGGLKLGVELLAPLSRLQATLQLIDIPLTVSDTPAANGDKLVIGLLAPSDDLDPFIQPFHINLEDDDVVAIPGFGDVNRSGLGVLLFSPGANGSTLVVLADSPENLLRLIGVLAYGDLSSCVIQGDIGVCVVGYGSGFYSEPSLWESTPIDIPIPEEYGG